MVEAWRSGRGGGRQGVPRWGLGGANAGKVGREDFTYIHLGRGGLRCGRINSHGRGYVLVLLWDGGCVGGLEMMGRGRKVGVGV